MTYATYIVTFKAYEITLDSELRRKSLDDVECIQIVADDIIDAAKKSLPQIKGREILSIIRLA